MLKWDPYQKQAQGEQTGLFERTGTVTEDLYHPTSEMISFVCVEGSPFTLKQLTDAVILHVSKGEKVTWKRDEEEWITDGGGYVDSDYVEED